jgi:hypothetical protein
MVFSSVSEADDYFARLGNTFGKAKNLADLYKIIVNAPFSDIKLTTTLGLGVLTLVLVNKTDRTIDRISMSDTDMAQGARDITVKPFNDLIIPYNYRGNIVSEAIRSGRSRQTSDWHYLLTPVLKPEDSRMNQAGAVIFHYFITMDKIGNDHTNFMFRYIKTVSQALKEVKVKS